MRTDTSALTQTDPPVTSRRSIAVHVGAVTVGGGAPVVVQSMTNTDTADVEATRITSYNVCYTKLLRVDALTPQVINVLQKEVIEQMIFSPTDKEKVAKEPQLPKN